MGSFHLLWVYPVFSEFLFSVHSDNQEVIYNITNITINHRFPFLLSNLMCEIVNMCISGISCWQIFCKLYGLAQCCLIIYFIYRKLVYLKVNKDYKLLNSIFFILVF